MKKHNDKSIKENLGILLNRNQSLKKGLDIVRIKEIYKSQMGEVINKYTTDLKFKNGELSIYLNSAPLKKELSMNQDKVKHLLNTAVGSDLVKQVKIY